MEKKNLTYEEYQRQSIILADKCISDKTLFDGIYPIPRGGYIPAIIIAKRLQLPIIFDKQSITPNTLIVDDISDSGSTLLNFPKNKTAVVFVKPRSKVTPNYSAETIPNDCWMVFPDEGSTSIEENIKRIIEYIGDDPTREGLVGTPDRIIRMYKEIFRGYNPTEKPKITTFRNENRITDMVFDSGEYYSMCEHHILPFFGKYYFAYIPSPEGRILGLSKIARVVGYCAARLQLQERLAKDIVEMLSGALDGKVQGMAIVMKGTHLCKVMRGARNNGRMGASYFTGAFKTDATLRRDFYAMIESEK